MAAEYSEQKLDTRAKELIGKGMDFASAKKKLMSEFGVDEPTAAGALAVKGMSKACKDWNEYRKGMNKSQASDIWDSMPPEERKWALNQTGTSAAYAKLSLKDFPSPSGKDVMTDFLNRMARDANKSAGMKKATGECPKCGGVASVIEGGPGGKTSFKCPKCGSMEKSAARSELGKMWKMAKADEDRGAAIETKSMGNGATYKIWKNTDGTYDAAVTINGRAYDELTRIKSLPELKNWCNEVGQDAADSMEKSAMNKFNAANAVNTMNDPERKKVEEMCDGDIMCERQCFHMLEKNHMTADNALQVYTNSVEGDTSQLPDKLAAYAKRKGWFKGFDKSAMGKDGVASMPADQKKSIDTDLHSYKPKFGKAKIQMNPMPERDKDGNLHVIVELDNGKQIQVWGQGGDLDRKIAEVMQREKKEQRDKDPEYQAASQKWDKLKGKMGKARAYQCDDCKPPKQFPDAKTLEAHLKQTGHYNCGFSDVIEGDNFKSKWGKSALAKAWGQVRKADDEAEYEKERKEHPDMSEDIIRQIVADHARERTENARKSMAKAPHTYRIDEEVQIDENPENADEIGYIEKIFGDQSEFLIRLYPSGITIRLREGDISPAIWVSKSQVEHGHEPAEIEVKHSIGAKDFAIIDACFLKSGEYNDNAGQPHFYGWPEIEQAKDTFKGQKLYLEHKEGVGYEYGLITDVRPELINDENWLVARVKVPEVAFTQDLLARVEAGLAVAISNTHVATPSKDGSVTNIRGKALSLVKEGEVPGARVLNITRHVAG